MTISHEATKEVHPHIALELRISSCPLIHKLCALYIYFKVFPAFELVILRDLFHFMLAGKTEGKGSKDWFVNSWLFWFIPWHYSIEHYDMTGNSCITKLLWVRHPKQRLKDYKENGWHSKICGFLMTAGSSLVFDRTLICSVWLTKSLMVLTWKKATQGIITITYSANIKYSLSIHWVQSMLHYIHAKKTHLSL